MKNSPLVSRILIIGGPDFRALRETLLYKETIQKCFSRRTGIPSEPLRFFYARGDERNRSIGSETHGVHFLRETMDEIRNDVPDRRFYLDDDDDDDDEVLQPGCWIREDPKPSALLQPLQRLCERS